jgi:hypothetical protein
MRPAIDLQARLVKIKNMLGWSGRVVGLHVRHGDSCADIARKQCIPAETYFEEAEKVAAKYKMEAIFLATDDPDVAHKARLRNQLKEARGKEAGGQGEAGDGRRTRLMAGGGQPEPSHQQTPGHPAQQDRGGYQGQEERGSGGRVGLSVVQNSVRYMISPTKQELFSNHMYIEHRLNLGVVDRKVRVELKHVKALSKRMFRANAEPRCGGSTGRKRRSFVDFFFL